MQRTSRYNRGTLPGKLTPYRHPFVHPVIALLLLARELLGHRLDRELRGPGTLSLNRRKCRLVQIRNEPAHARACTVFRLARAPCWGAY